ncbi:MAG: 30S ribosomal protein S20 [Myxococcota bacterium]|nr:30S ribosomal protein S20 [Myxococcota bacterium]
MANHPQAEKRARQSERRRSRNKAVKTGVRTAVRKLRAAVAAGPGADLDKLLEAAVSGLDRARSKGVMARNTTSRLISRLTRAAKKK